MFMVENMIKPMRSYMTWKWRQDKAVQWAEGQNAFATGALVWPLKTKDYRSQTFEVVSKPVGGWVYIRPQGEHGGGNVEEPADGEEVLETSLDWSGEHNAFTNEEFLRQTKGSEAGAVRRVRVAALEPVTSVGLCSKVYDKLKKALKAILFALALVLLVFMKFLLSVINLAFNVYIIIASFFDVNDFVDHLEVIRRVVHQAFDHIHIPYVAHLYNQTLLLFSYIKLDINIGAEVTCQAAQAPLMMAFNIALILCVIVIFDSGAYLFFDIAGRDFRVHSKSETVFRFSDMVTEVDQYSKIPKTRKVRRPIAKCGAVLNFKTYIAQLAITFFGKGLKVMMQLSLTKLYLKEFFPYWRRISRACNDEDSDVTGAETVMRVCAIYTAWVLAPFLVSTLLNTFVWGYVGHDTHISDIAGFHRGKRGEKDGQTSRLNFFDTQRSWAVFFPHNPGRLQTANSFAVLGIKYLRLMGMKAFIILKLTVGWWDTDLIDTYDITNMGENFDVEVTDEDHKHIDLMTSIGTAYSIIWQIFPYCSVSNLPPLFKWDAC